MKLCFSGRSGVGQNAGSGETNRSCHDASVLQLIGVASSLHSNWTTFPFPALQFTNRPHDTLNRRASMP